MFEKRKQALTRLKAVQEEARVRAQKRGEAAAAAEKEKAPITPGTFTIVSGLPRSGTSLMMQMLTQAVWK